MQPAIRQINQWDRIQELERTQTIGNSQRGNPLRFVFLGVELGMKLGRNELSVFVYNESKWGDMGRNRLSPLEMGTKGGGRVSNIPRL